MFVRTASERDIPAVGNLLAETLHATYDPFHDVERVEEFIEERYSLATLRQGLNQPNAEFLVADDGRQLGGMAHAVANSPGKSVAIRQLYVRPTFQGRGIGSMLLDEIIESFPDATLFRLDIDEADTRAIAFCLSQGFEQSGTDVTLGGRQPGVGEIGSPTLTFTRRRGA